MCIPLAQNLMFQDFGLNSFPVQPSTEMFFSPLRVVPHGASLQLSLVSNLCVYSVARHFNQTEFL